VTPLVWEVDTIPELRSPILVAAFEGWFDVGEAATGAVAALRGTDASELARVDPDLLFDFTERRPTVGHDDGIATIRWPHNRVHSRVLRGQARDLVLMEGVEPHLRWQTFADAVLEIVDRMQVALVVTLGAMVAEVPHTRPLSVTGSTSDPQLARALRLDQPSYQGPTGVVGVLQHRLDAAGIPAVSLRAGVPHYVSGAPNPKASRALLERFERVTGLPTRWAELDEAATEWERRVDEAMDDDVEITGYVRMLEQRYDDRASSSVPSSDDLAAEFERFLRQQGDSDR